MRRGNRNRPVKTGGIPPHVPDGGTGRWYPTEAGWPEDWLRFTPISIPTSPAQTSAGEIIQIEDVIRRETYDVKSFHVHPNCMVSVQCKYAYYDYDYKLVPDAIPGTLPFSDPYNSDDQVWKNFVDVTFECISPGPVFKGDIVGWMYLPLPGSEGTLLTADSPGRSGLPFNSESGYPDNVRRRAWWTNIIRNALTWGHYEEGDHIKPDPDDPSGAVYNPKLQFKSLSDYFTVSYQFETELFSADQNSYRGVIPWQVSGTEQFDRTADFWKYMPFEPSVQGATSNTEHGVCAIIACKNFSGAVFESFTTNGQVRRDEGVKA